MKNFLITFLLIFGLLIGAFIINKNNKTVIKPGTKLATTYNVAGVKCVEGTCFF